MYPYTTIECSIKVSKTVQENHKIVPFQIIIKQYQHDIASRDFIYVHIKAK